MVTKRQEEILKGVLIEYIDSVKPVSSQLIEEKYGLGACSATIRNEMKKLSEMGFLDQPHISAGRVPTDKAYRFLVNSLLEKETSKRKASLELKKIIEEERKDLIGFVNRLSKFLAAKSLNLATIHLLGEDLFWKEGWGEVLKAPESKKDNFTDQFIRLLSSFEEEAKSFDLETEMKIYIGKENPFTESDDFSIIVTKCLFPKKKEGVISLIGPKRMKYQNSISLIHSILEILD